MASRTVPTSAQDGLSDREIQTLKESAVQAKDNAYCPYSRFRVGAAFLTSDGHVMTGANVENASYPVGTCAERVALGKAVVSGNMNPTRSTERPRSSHGGELREPITYFRP
ncbi:MAG: hypothetical protein L6R41_001408 [Letrouitia leprolyta]|nr:MAG: hypothetical protein L6R41_001408 [Letrouitia leprolyta]